jgi:hypothetical protein
VRKEGKRLTRRDDPSLRMINPQVRRAELPKHFSSPSSRRPPLSPPATRLQLAASAALLPPHIGLCTAIGSDGGVGRCPRWHRPGMGSCEETGQPEPGADPRGGPHAWSTHIFSKWGSKLEWTYVLISRCESYPCRRKSLVETELFPERKALFAAERAAFDEPVYPTVGVPIGVARVEETEHRWSYE